MEPNNSSHNYKGYLDDVKIWGKAFSQEEIVDEYNKTAPDNLVNNFRNNSLIAHYTFDGNTLDSSVYEHHTAPIGGLLYADDEDRGTVAFLDGLNDYIDTRFNFHPANYHGKMTVSLWMRNAHSNK